MTAHIVTTPATGPTAPATAAPAAIVTAPAAAGAGLPGAWLPLSAAFTEAVADLTDREDLTVRCAPGLGHGAPGCFVPALATIELDGAHLGHRPETCDPTRPADRYRYPALWGVLVHEAAHATHTRWTPPTGAPSGASSAAIDAALALEESRIEAAQLRRRPADRPWLRAVASTIVLPSFFTTAPAAAPSATGPAGAAGVSAAPAVAPGAGAGAAGGGASGGWRRCRHRARR
jgi:hypothetical protein